MTPRKEKGRAETAYQIIAAFGQVHIMMIGRLIAGAGCGVATVVVPLVLDQLARFSNISRLGIFNQLGITIGITSALALSIPLGSPTSWRWVPLVPAILAFAHGRTVRLIPDPLFAEQQISSNVSNSQASDGEHDSLVEDESESARDSLPSSPISISQVRLPSHH